MRGARHRCAAVAGIGSHEALRTGTAAAWHVVSRMLGAALPGSPIGFRLGFECWPELCRISSQLMKGAFAPIEKKEWEYE